MRIQSGQAHEHSLLALLCRFWDSLELLLGDEALPTDRVVHTATCPCLEAEH